MRENKTKPEATSVDDFLHAVEGDKRRAEGLEMLELMKKLTGEKPVMWGKSMVGFGQYHYKGKSREGDWLTIGFSPRKAALTLYGLIHYEENRDYLKALGPNATGAGCIYVKDLSKLDKKVLAEMITHSFKKNNGKILDYSA